MVLIRTGGLIPFASKGGGELMPVSFATKITEEVAVVALRILLMLLGVGLALLLALDSTRLEVTLGSSLLRFTGTG